MAYTSLLSAFGRPDQPLEWSGHIGFIFLSGILGLFLSSKAFFDRRQLEKREHEIQVMQSNLRNKVDALVVPNMQELLARQAQKISLARNQYGGQSLRVHLHVFTLADDVWKIIASSADPSTTNVHQIGLKQDEGVVGYTSSLGIPTVLEVEANSIFDQFREYLANQQPLRLQNRGRLGGNIRWIYSAPIWERSFLAEPAFSPRAVGILTIDTVDEHADTYFFNRQFQNILNASAYEISPYVTVFTTLRNDGSAYSLERN